MAWLILLLIFGVFACSTAVIFIKVCGIHPVLLAAYRLIVAALVLAPLFLRDLRRHRNRYGLAELRKSLLPGVLLAAHFTLWIIGARMTLAANAALIVNMVPVVMPFLLYLLVRERLTRGEGLATIVAMAGVAVLAGADYHGGTGNFLGDVVCFASMLLLAVYLAMGRRNRDFPTVWLYVVPLYAVAGLVCFAASLFFTSPLAVESSQDLMLAGALGIVPTVMGHSIMNYCMRHIRGQAVSVANLGQFIFSGVMAFFLLAEAPQWTFYAACPLVITGAVWALRSMPARTL
ncbi:MAG: DMT family transporter [Planctomycetota bacterium]|nr:DMT family transporter [Planctomycetota bacterium]